MATLFFQAISFPANASESTSAEVQSPSDRPVSSLQSDGTLLSESSQSSVSSDESVPTIACPQSEVFEISTRHLPKTFCAINDENPGFEVNRWTGCNWARSDIHSALGIENAGSDSAEGLRIDDKPTILYVHGNFMERNNTLQRVRIIDSQLKRRATRDYRLIVLSWPSQKSARPIQSVYDNAESSEDQSLYVAWVLRKLKHHTRVSLLGFSFGARAVTGGLHLDAGGRIPGLAHRADPDGTIDAGTRYLPYRVGLIASAIDKTWIESCGRHRHALDQVSHFVNMYNSSDPALRRFRFVDRVTKPIAGGFAGFDVLTDSRTTFQLERSGMEHVLPLKVEQFNCSSTVGKTHDEQSYLGQCPYFNRMIDVLLWTAEPSDEIIRSLVSNN